MNKIDVVGLGVSTLDSLNLIEYFPVGESVQESLQSKLEGGGPVATALVTLARLGISAAMLDSLGDDWIGNTIIQEFIKEKVNTDHIKINKGCTSSFATVLTTKHDGARTIIYSPANSPAFNVKDIPEELIKRAKFLHINGRHLPAAAGAIRIAQLHNTKVSFDGGSNRFREELRELVLKSNIAIITKDFAEKFTNINSIPEAGRNILQSGPEIVVVTDGINGSWLFTDKINEYHQKAFLMENVIDTTGCGDSYHGAFLYGLCKDYDHIKCMKIASAVAALNTRKLGGKAALPNEKELQNFFGKV